MRDLAVTPGAHPANDDDLLRAFEKTMFGSIFDDPRGKCRADARQAHQFLDSGCIYVDLFLSRVSRYLKENQHYKDEREITKKTK